MTHTTHWVRYRHEGAVGFGTLANDAIHIHDGHLFEAPRPTGSVLPLEQVTLLAPAVPGKMLALWNNSRAMAAKLDQAIPAEPLFFIKANGSYLGPEAVIRKPASYDGKVVFEGELGIVIGRECRSVSPAASPGYIFGYTCINDVTAIGIVGEDPSFPQWTRAKSYETFGVFGPVIATGLDPETLTIRTLVDGSERQRYPVTDLIFGPADIVSRISRDTTLHPGDVICCGTSTGVGSLKPGNTVEVTIEGIGTLRNRYEESTGPTEP